MFYEHFKKIIHKYGKWNNEEYIEKIPINEKIDLENAIYKELEKVDYHYKFNRDLIKIHIQDGLDESNGFKIFIGNLNYCDSSFNHGLFLLYSFRNNGSGFTLSLNQGEKTPNIKKRLKIAQKLKKLCKLSQNRGHFTKKTEYFFKDAIVLKNYSGLKKRTSNDLIYIYNYYIDAGERYNKIFGDKNKKTHDEKKYDFQKYLLNKGYFFEKETIENYLLSLKVKPFVILTGNSGTGKTKLSQLFAQYLSENNENYKIIPVGANWTENRHIIGYYNILTNEHKKTPAYELIEESQNSDKPYFLILDEMNLSHVERYFADFLSAIESNESIPVEGRDDLEIPDNLFIIGTVNVDETTYMFSPKVLDRANTIEFKTHSAKDYMANTINIDAPNGDIDYLENLLVDSNIKNMDINQLKEEFKNITYENKDFWEVLSDEIFKFQEILKKSGFDFGFRVINEITRFMLVSWKYENSPQSWDNWQRYFDAQIKQKMLPKLHGSQKVIGETLDELLKASQEYETSKEKLEEMIDVLTKQRYVSYIN